MGNVERGFFLIKTSPGDSAILSSIVLGRQINNLRTFIAERKL